MRIAILSLHSSPFGDLGTSDTGGMSVYIRETARQLADWGHSLDIFTRRTRSDQAAVIAFDDRMRLIHLDAGPAESIPKLCLYEMQDAFIRALEHIRHEQRATYDLIHSHYWLSAHVGQQLSANWDLPHLATFHTLAAVKDRTGVAAPEPELRAASEKRLAGECNRILVATAREKEFMIRTYGVQPDKIGIIPCGVNLALFQPLDQVEARRKLKINPDETVVLYVGRFDAMKGIDRIVESIALLSSDQPLKLILVGGDGRGSVARNQIREQSILLGVEQAVQFAGRIDQKIMPLYYSAADVLTVASHYESFGLVGLEALACGTPVVATRVGAMDRVINENNGCLVDTPLPSEIARGICRCLSDSFRKKVSANSIRSTVAACDWSRTAAELQDEYLKAIRR